MFRRAAGFVAFVSGVVGSVALGVIALPLAQYDAGTGGGTRGQGVVTPVVRETDSPRDAQLLLEWSDSTEVRTDVVAGLVTAVNMAAGQLIGCGTVGFAVDDRPVVMLCGTKPLWRAIDARTRGTDADLVLDWARFLGIEVDVNPSTRDRDRAIRALQAVIGWPNTGAISPSDTVWLSMPMTPTRVEVAVGDRLTGGDLVVTIDASIAGTALNTELDAAVTAGALLSLQGSERRFPLGVDGQILDLAGLTAEIRASLQPDAELPPSVAVIVRSAKPVSAFVLPASAVVADGDGSCVHVKFGNTESRKVTVEVVDAVSDTVFVIGNLADSDLVAVDPDRASGC